MRYDLWAMAMVVMNLPLLLYDSTVHFQVVPDSVPLTYSQIVG
jgi:hypothetical protein